MFAIGVLLALSLMIATFACTGTPLFSCR